MKTFFRYWIARLFKSRRSAGAILAARSRKLNKRAAETTATPPAPPAKESL